MLKLCEILAMKHDTNIFLKYELNFISGPKVIQSIYQVNRPDTILGHK